MSEELKAGQLYQINEQWYVHVPEFDDFGPFDTKDEAFKKSSEYGRWLAAMEAN